MIAKILVVEDDLFFRTYIQNTIGSQFHLCFAKDVNEARGMIQSDSHDLFIVDVILPDGSGLDVCAFIRSQERTRNKPVIVLSSKNEIQDKVNGLEFGADDYLIKPCHPKELIARIKANLRRAEPSPHSESLQVVNYKIDFIRQRVYDPNGKSVELTNIEFKLLVFFARHQDHVLSRNQILAAVWTENLNVTERAVDTHVSNLRKKLGLLGENIKSVHGAGYTLSTPRAA